MFYQSLSGRRPFQHDSVAGVMDLHLKHEVPLLHDVCPHLPERLCDWVMWLMAREPNDRPANAQVALDSLRSLAAEGALHQAPPAANVSQPLVAHPQTGAVSPRPTASQPLRRPTISSPIRPATAVQPARPVAAGPQQVIHTTALIADDDDTPVARAIPVVEKKNSLLWVYIAAGAVVLGGAGFFMFKKPGAAAAKPGQTATAAPAGKLTPQPAGLLAKGAIIHWRAGEKLEAWFDPGKSASPVKPNDLGLNWHDLAPDAGDAVLSAADRKKEACPKYVFEQPGEFTQGIGFLRFDPGDAMSHRVDKAKNEAKSYPYGDSVKDKGLTLFMIVRPKVVEKEVNCLRLRNQDGKAWLQITAFPNNEFRAKVSVKQADGKDVVKECKVGGRSVKQFSLISLRADPTTKKLTLMVRSSGDGGKGRGECDMPPGCSVLNEVRISDVVKDPAHPPSSDSFFTGDVAEIVIWPRLMDQEEHAEQAQKLAEFYFKKPGNKW